MKPPFTRKPQASTEMWAVPIRRLIQTTLRSLQNQSRGVAGDISVLRSFSKVTGFGIPIVFGVALPILIRGHILLWPFLPGGCLLIAGWIWPAALTYPYVLWQGLGQGLHKLNSWIIFGLMFYLVICPIGFVFRCIGRDPMRRRIDSRIDSYRQDFSHDNPLERVDNIF
jgi:hypothetical protein